MAFYPDVIHFVGEIATGYRAVIAVKILRQHQETPEVPANIQLQRKIKDVLMQLDTPYGILLQHQYSAGTAELNGPDAVLHAAAGDTGGDVKLLPVLIRWTASRYEFSGHDPEDYDWGKNECRADVFPMTEAHVDT